MNILEILKLARIKKGYTQEFVAYKLGISSKAYSKIETGINRLNTDYLIPLCKILNLPPKEMALIFFGLLESEEEFMNNEQLFVSKYKQPNDNFTKADTKQNTSASLIIGKNYSKEVKRKKNNNVLLIGGAGTGKSRFFIKPNLLQLDASYIVTDPKGEFIYSIGNVFKENGYKIKRLDFENPQLSLKYNPFKYLKNDKDIQEMAECLFPSINNIDNIIETRKVCMMFIYYEKEHTSNIKSFKNIINKCKTLIDVENLFDDFNATSYQIFQQCNKDTMIKTITNISKSINAIFDDKICDIFDSDELNLTLFKKEKTVLFVMPSKTEWNTKINDNIIVTLFYTQLLSQINNINITGKTYSIKIFMDEFGIYGLIPNFINKVKNINSNVSISVIVQELKQFMTLHSDIIKTEKDICESFSTILFMGGDDSFTLYSLTQLIMETSKNICTVDMLQNKENDDIIIIEKDKPTMKDKKFKYENHKMYNLTADYDDSNAYK